MSNQYKPHDADIRVGRLLGIEVSLAQGFALGTVAVLVVFWMVGIVVFHRRPANALAGAFALTLLHWLNELVHNYGHYRAARSTGFPMEGVRLGTRESLSVFGTSVYPTGEQELSARVHIRRALGGPIANAILGVVGLLPLLLLSATGSHFAWVAVVFVAENLLVFAVGNLLPVGFNDGSTLLHWMRRR
jgi:Zn-dependent protease